MSLCGKQALAVRFPRQLPTQYFCAEHAPEDAIALFTFEQHQTKVCEWGMSESVVVSRQEERD